MPRPSQTLAEAKARWEWRAGIASYARNRNFDVEAAALAERRKRLATPLEDEK